MPRPVKTRTYTSQRRTEQAEATRRAILDAALTAFVQDGYAATTIDGIAGAAGVSVQTVYKVFRTKRTLLEHLVDEAMAGEPDRHDLIEQDWFREQLDERDPARQLALIARNARRMYDRSGALLRVVRDAAASGRDIAELWDQISKRRRQRSRATAKNLVGKRGRLRHRTDTVADILWTQTSPEVWDMLVREAGWSADRYERWLADALQALLLA